VKVLLASRGEKRSEPARARKPLKAALNKRLAEVYVHLSQGKGKGEKEKLEVDGRRNRTADLETLQKGKKISPQFSF
jgi:hypothetical protein